MAKEEKTLGGLGEITAIRDILFGQQVNEIQQKFDASDDRMAAVREALEQKIDALEKDMNHRVSELEKSMNARFDKLENLLADNVQTLENKLADTSTKDKDFIGQMLQEMGAKLVSEK